jgi:hypothetical protein
MSKCVACGYEYKPGDKRIEIRSLKFNRSDKIRKLLNTAIKNIQQTIPTENKSYKEYAFLYGIRKYDDEFIEHSVKAYMLKQEYKKGKGYAYLRAMIQNSAEELKLKKDAERKLLGKTPKNIKNKKKELGYDK